MIFNIHYIYASIIIVFSLYFFNVYNKISLHIYLFIIFIHKDIIISIEQILLDIYLRDL